MSEQETPIIELKDIKVQFALREGTVKAVDGVTFNIKPGKTLGVVGESGSGKSVSARAIMQIIGHPGKIVNGDIYFRRPNGHSKAGDEVINLAKLNPRGNEIRKIRGGEIAMVFQEPMTSLSPVHTIANQIMEAILLHQDVSKQEARNQAIEMLRLVNMPKPEQVIDSYPHQLSGGMRQRAMIAMALSCKPTLLIADEPTTALDVTTEAQILELMRNLQEQLGMAILYITHNLGVIAEMTEDVIVMYLGKVVERGDVDSIFHGPKHPYTRDLLKSIPKMTEENEGERLQAIEGMVPDPFSLPSGCTFHPRCQEFIKGVCDVKEPPDVDLGNGRYVRCHLYGEEQVQS
jgi:oligopeptide/dipeptide ABC transporter ATP-binding protein